jgi:hypothetical protein
MLKPVQKNPLSSVFGVTPGRATGSVPKRGDTLEVRQNGSFWETALQAAYRLYRWCLWALSQICHFEVEETPEERTGRLCQVLEGHFRTFLDYAKRQDRNELRVWWRKCYLHLPLDIRKMLLLEDVKTYAGAAEDKKAWALENFKRYQKLAQQFICELEVINGNDPIDYLPGYLKAVLRELRSTSFC